MKQQYLIFLFFVTVFSLNCIFCSADEIFQNARGVYEKETAEQSDLNKIYNQVFRYAKEQKYADMLDIIEPIMTSGKRVISDDNLISLYKKAGLAERGYKFWNNIFEKIDYDRRSDWRHITLLFELSLVNKKYAKALEVLRCRQKKFRYRDFLIDYARIYAAINKKESVMNLLAEYLKDSYSLSRASILRFPEFEKYHNDADFIELMTDTPQLRNTREKYEREILGMDDTEFLGFPTPEKHSFEEILSYCNVYKTLNPEMTEDEIYEKTYGSNMIIADNVRRYENQFLDMLKNEKQGTFFRAILADALTGRAVQLQKVIDIIKNDDFTSFPEECLNIAENLSRYNYDIACPFLRQAFIAYAKSISPEHSSSSEDFQRLFMIFGRQEYYCQNDLLEFCRSNEPAIAKNAMRLLVIFGNSRVLDILQDMICRTQNSEKKEELLDLMGKLNLPETLDVLKHMQQNVFHQNPEMTGKIDLIIQRIVSPGAPPESITQDVYIFKNRNMKKVFFNNLAVNFGSDVSYLAGTIIASSTKEDIPDLVKIRGSILNRYSDEAMYDYALISQLITWLRWSE